MATRKVRVGQVFIYNPVLIDKINPPYNVAFGDVVRVINKYGCPPANTMGHRYVEHLDGQFAGLVATNSLDTREEFTAYLKERIGTHSENPINKNARVA
jgi:hypothetical protein